MWRLCQELRTSDLIASDGKNEFRILLTTPDAENADAIAERIDQFSGKLNNDHAQSDEPLMVQVEAEPVRDGPQAHGPCDPCEEQAFLVDEHTIL